MLKSNFPVTQFDKNDVETAGLVKFDFLGLRIQACIIDWALGLVNPRLKKEGKEPVRIESILWMTKRRSAIQNC
ncbi:hypothetical protein OH492_05675 [Vibrio chagasii]|nr:hypothetical protein [Vibrio chagasii]